MVQVQTTTPRILQFSCGGEPPGAKNSLSIRATGLVTMTAAANDGDTVTINDGRRAQVFEFDTVAAASGTVTIAVGNAADGNTVTLIDALGVTVVFEFESTGGVAAGNIAVTVGADNNASAANLRSAINAVQTLRITASVTTNVVTVTQDDTGTAGNTTITVVGANLSKTNFTGGDSLAAGTALAIAVAVGTTPAACAANLVTAINGAADFRITARTDDATVAADVVLENTLGGTAGNVAITESTAAARITVTGMTGATDTRIGIIERVDGVRTPTIHATIRNTSPTQNLVLTAQDSPDNLRAGYDSGGNITMRVNGANVTTVTVKPGGRLPVDIENLPGAGKYVRFSASPEGSTSGVLTILYPIGEIHRIDRELDAP